MPASTTARRAPRSAIAPALAMNALTWILILAIVACAIVMLVDHLQSGYRIEAPPRADPAGIQAMSEAELFPRVVSDLRFAVAAGGQPVSRWRTLPEAARHVLAVSWVQADDPPGPRPPTSVFRGFRAQAADRSPNAPTLAEIAEAYGAIGVPEAAALVTEADQLCRADDAAGVAAVDGRFAALSRRPSTIAALHAYLRAHADELAGAKVP